MIRLIKHFILTLLKPLDRRGYVFSMRQKVLPPHVVQSIFECKPRSFCPFIHFDAAWRAIHHADRNGIEGDIVLCGVADGGLARFLANYRGSRRLWLYDTFDGGSLPGIMDGEFERKHGDAIRRIMATNLKRVQDYVGRADGHMWIVGDILKTIPGEVPEKIAVLYLDTDYYESTFHELVHMEPRVQKGGVIIQDEMGLCVGARRAVEEYYRGQAGPWPFIVPIDEAGCIWQKR